MTDLCVIIVTWNSVRDIEAALRSLLNDLHDSFLTARVLVVDSASTDNTVAHVDEQFSGYVEVLALDTNIGFARANNVGLAHLGYDTIAAAPFVLLLNPDTITRPGTIRALLDVLTANPGMGVAGPSLVYGDNSFQHGAFAFPGLRQLWAEFFRIPGRWREGTFNGRYPQALYQGQTPFDVDFVLGACMLVRAEAIAKVGFFDERFFMYCEEVDWQWRMKRSGWRIVCVPTATMVHLGGQSTAQAKPRSIVNLWESRLLLYDKHYGLLKRWLARRLVAWGIERQQQHVQQPELQQAYRRVLKATRTR